MLIGKLYLHTDLVLCAFYERYLVYDHHRSLHCIIRAIDREREFVEANVSTRISADV